MQVPWDSYCETNLKAMPVKALDSHHSAIGKQPLVHTTKSTFPNYVAAAEVMSSNPKLIILVNIAQRSLCISG